jgi:hypothetical protein
VPPAASGRGQAPPDRSARQGRQTDAEGCGGASTIAAGAVGSERPGLKPRAQSVSPLKGAVRRPGARVDRLGGGAVWISRLQPAWGLSPAVHGRAIVETGAQLIGAACRARRVGHLESPRHSARRARQRLAPTQVVRPSTIAPHGRRRSGERRRLVGVRRCLTRRPAGPVNRRPMVAALPLPRTMARRPRSIAAPVARSGEAAPRPYKVGRPIPDRRQRHHRDARPPVW